MKPQATADTIGLAEVADIERELMLISRYVVMTAAARAAAPGAEQRLDRSAYLLLSRIEAGGPMSIGQLSEAFGLDTSTINRQTAAMLRAGLVERIPDPDGGIARKLRITEHGLDRLGADRAWAVNGITKYVHDWDQADLATLAHLLTRFNMSMEKGQGPGRRWPRGS
ncbi:winged helix-turn-helix transcriptional regulator [Frankia sp. CNm7]|uniref:Winged helix-turn-helix transcriptional regulator n=1 Tax=Frankia nepalensis TaxID=1836974 RepID=A0A937R8H2_9ACTN|nr:MarR family winged helix-turn-helix transcriptional regulator [Frankia nepalensis]MBL7496394.1 winged helix-turn-helix transcriptional regulator [Frankia nepalensis]MBL7511456.1 winged helix-turn-helix transcriptional regulator [Frankia nepalensis]MBL7523583.1 winged helix-turn-helix transcriptional regulator [Frankia nepalensis]MBL7627321.1 winged helix-turn-helix transcriptional regulator [Frankia nepalensis]